jgi:apolipoprotein N-acyltransferase
MLAEFYERVKTRPVGIWILLLGALMTLGYAPFGLWPVSVASLAGLWIFVKRARSWRQAGAAALVWGMGHGVTALYWLPWAFYKDMGSMTAALGGGGGAVVGLAFYSSLVAVLASVLAFIRKRNAAVWVSVWVVLEFVKGLSPLGFPWLPVGAVWASSLPFMQSAALVGVWGMSALVLTLAVLVSELKPWRWVSAALLVLVVGISGQARLAQAPEILDGPVVRVVQPNIQSAHKWDAHKRWEFLQRTMEIALPGAALAPATVIMPETAVAFYLDEEDDVRSAIADALQTYLPEDGALVTGTVRREVTTGEAVHYYNSLTVMQPSGLLVDTYDKRLLVPYGEYIPFRGFLDMLPLPAPVRVLSQSRLDYTAGVRDPHLPTPAGIAVGLICYEGIFPLQVLEAAHGARYLINITNDNWFTGTIALYQHAALARMRAVETGLPMVRVANTGLTVVFDGYGREVLRLPINRAVRADVALPQAHSTPLRRLVTAITGLSR